MRPSIRKALVYGTLTGSLLLNAGLIGYLAKSGGLRRIFLKLDMTELPVNRVPFQAELEERYRKFPNTPDEIIFAGDSQIGGGHWAEFYSDVHNRGIGGDSIKGLLSRLTEITEGHPRRLFLLIGANDLVGSVPEVQFLRLYRKLLERVARESPATRVTVLGLLPMNPDFPDPPRFGNDQVAAINARLKELVAEFPGMQFFDLAPTLADDRGRLRKEYSLDGLHLNLDGYLALREPLLKLVRPTASPSEEAPPP